LKPLGVTDAFIDFLNGLPGLAYVRNDRSETLYINQAYARAFHVSLEDAFLRSPREWLTPVQAAQQEAQDREVLETGRPVLQTISDQTTTGDMRFWRVFRFPLLADDGSQLVAGWVIDMTRDLLAAERLSAMEQQVNRLRVLEDALDGIAQLDHEGKIQYANYRLGRILDLSPGDMIGKTLRDLAFDEDAVLLQAACSRLQEVGRAETECRFSSQNGTVTAWIKLIRDPGSESLYLFMQDTTLQREFQDQLERSMSLLHEAQVQLAARQADLEAANERLAVLAITDGLTGLVNHKQFHEEIHKAIAHAKRYGNAFSILMLDIDFFKQYNDGFGHPAGDEAIRMFADLLKQQVRATDIVARYGGEEFGVLLAMADQEAARLLAERIREAVEQAPWPLQPITTSVGLATFGKDGETSQEVLEAADRALYEAKRAGRNRVAVAGAI
jgi:diguanylate cyclase (GGDEF)-like protein/PAS domain S-box-containing protein